MEVFSIDIKNIHFLVSKTNTKYNNIWFIYLFIFGKKKKYYSFLKKYFF